MSFLIARDGRLRITFAGWFGLSQANPVDSFVIRIDYLEREALVLQFFACDRNVAKLIDYQSSDGSKIVRVDLFMRSTELGRVILDLNGAAFLSASLEDIQMACERLKNGDDLLSSLRRTS